MSTTHALVRAARESFGRGGFADTSVEDIAALAGVTSGAAYHHFKDKRDIFRAVFHEAEQTLATRVQDRAIAGRNPWERLELGIAEYLRACAEPDFRRIVLLDGPSVLGWSEWRTADEAYHMRPLAAALASAMHAKQVERRPPLPLARVLLGLLTEVGLARAEDRSSAERECLWLVRRLRR